jgi:RNA polymerase sigma factor (sigma-70 family)
MGDTPPPDQDFKSFYQTTLTPLRRYLATVLGNPHEAQDIAHDAYMRTYTAMQGQAISQPKAFLFTTARRLALNFRIRRGGRMRPEENTVLDRQAADTPDAGQITMARQERAAMEAAIAGLPEGCREVLVIRTMEELSHQEIADRLGLSRSTVEKHLARALRLLREALAEKPSHPPHHES